MSGDLRARAAQWARLLRRRHVLFGIVTLALLSLFLFTDAGRDDRRANALAASAMLTDGLVAEDGPIEPVRIEAWNRSRHVLDVAGLAGALELSEGHPIHLDPVAPIVDARSIETTLEQQGLQPVDEEAFALGRLHIEAVHGTGGHLGVTATFTPRGGVAAEATELADTRIAGPPWSVLPPLLAVLIALFYGRAILALASAVVLGGALVAGFEPIATIVNSLGYLWEAVSDSFRLYILAFTVALVGMVQVTGRSGGNKGLIDAVAKLARTARSSRVATFLMGLVVFFDDYANSLVVGASARSLTDRMRISREKLAYIVDSTAAPVAGLAVISTWVGYEVGLFESLSSDLGLGQAGFAIFLEVIPTRFYCIFALAFVVMGAFMGRDYGPMRVAEARAAAGKGLGAIEMDGRTKKLIEKVTPDEDTPARWYNAAVPVLLTLTAVVVGIAWDGTRAVVEEGGVAPDLATFAGWRVVFSTADNGMVLFYSSVLGAVAAIVMAVGQRILSFRESIAAFVAGVRMMAVAVAILVLAWCIQAVTNEIGTSYYLVSVLEPVLQPAILPIAVFLAAAAVAFATGTSWGTMGILLPALIPLAWTLTSGDVGLTILCMGAVLDGAIFGDHCSPISDTTVMSSLACGCDHIEHVRTQMPYAVTVMIVAAGLGYALVPLGIPVGICLVAGLAALAGILLFVGRPVDRPASLASGR